MIAELRGQGLTMKQTAQALTENGFKTARGGQWWASSIRSVEQAERNDLRARWIRLGFRCSLQEDDIVYGAPKPVVVGSIAKNRLSPWLVDAEMRDDAAEVMGFSDTGPMLIPAAMRPQDILEWIDIQRKEDRQQVKARLQALGELRAMT